MTHDDSVSGPAGKLAFDHHPPSDGAAAVSIFMKSDGCRELYEQAIAAFAADHFN